MAAKTKIEWADATWCPWWGCTAVSTGALGACTNCYAEKWAKRWGVLFGNHPRRLSSPKVWLAPLDWQRKARKAGRKLLVFCSSMSDIFDNQVDPEWRRWAFAVMRECPDLIFLLLTKRPQNIEKMCAEAGGLPHNAAIGCSVVTPEEANRDIPHLLWAKFKLRALFAFVSCEPLMAHVNLQTIKAPHWALSQSMDALTGDFNRSLTGAAPPTRLDWVIAGGESGPKARPSHPDWFRSLRDQCAAAGVPFLFKQWGEWAPVDESALPERFGPACDRFRIMQSCGFVGAVSLESAFLHKPARYPDCFPVPEGDCICKGAVMCRVGKEAAGRLLDGVEHNGFPALAGERIAA